MVHILRECKPDCDIWCAAEESKINQEYMTVWQDTRKEECPKEDFETVEGMRFFLHPYGIPIQQHIDSLRHMTLRYDDIFLCAYPKAG